MKDFRAPRAFFVLVLFLLVGAFAPRVFAVPFIPPCIEQCDAVFGAPFAAVTVATHALGGGFERIDVLLPGLIIDALLFGALWLLIEWYAARYGKKPEQGTEFRNVPRV